MYSGQLMRYGMHYTGWYLVISLAIYVLVGILPAFEIPTGFVELSTAIAVHDRFCRDTGRIASRSEYWMLVALATGLGLTLNAFMLVGSLAVLQQPGPPAAVWLTLLPLVIPLTLMINMAVLSPFMGRMLLRQQKR